MDNKYYNKYLKYKNKYENLKRSLDNVQYGGNKNKILIVVDVQNCFLEDFGSYSWQPNPILSNPNRVQLINAYKKRLHDLIESARKDFDIIIFTKDSHPSNHGSFSYVKGIHPPHCIDDKKGKICHSQNTQTPSTEIQTAIQKDLAQKERKGNRLIQLDISNQAINLEDPGFMPYNFKINMNTQQINEINETEKHKIKYQYPWIYLYFDGKDHYDWYYPTLISQKLTYGGMPTDVPNHISELLYNIIKNV